MGYTNELPKTPLFTRIRVELAELADLAKRFLPKKRATSFRLRKKPTKNKHGNSNAQPRASEVASAIFHFF